MRETLERGAEWRGTEASAVEAGPSTRTCRDHVNPNFLRSFVPSLRPFPEFLQAVLRSATYTLVVNDLGDGCELAGEGAGNEQHNAADLDEPPGAGFH